jgi:hypothetical protein
MGTKSANTDPSKYWLNSLWTRIRVMLPQIKKKKKKKQLPKYQLSFKNIKLVFFIF